MANEYTALVVTEITAVEKLDGTTGDGVTGDKTGTMVNATGGRRWSNGTGSGKIGKIYKAILAFTSGETKNYNLLAAGSLTTPDGESIDADELKFLGVKCTAGEFKFVGTVSNQLDVFTAASEGLQLKAAGGLRSLPLDFGPDGLDVTTNSQFALIETGSSTAAGELIFGVAE